MKDSVNDRVYIRLLLGDVMKSEIIGVSGETRPPYYYVPVYRPPQQNFDPDEPAWVLAGEGRPARTQRLVFTPLDTYEILGGVRIWHYGLKLD